MVNLLGLSIISSALGVHGLGQLALEKSYTNLELSYVFSIILLAVTIIYIIKLLGKYVANNIQNKPEQQTSIANQ